MGGEPDGDVGVGRLLLRSPWAGLPAGLLVNLAAWLWLLGFGSMAVALVLLGLLATGTAVVLRPRSPVILVLAAVSAWLASHALAPWDSAQLLARVLAAVALFAALVVCLPRILQRAVVSMLIVLHFIGILSAVSSVPPTPALMNWAWAYLYRPYLQFMYLNNAYHFYSPEPGPGVMVWFFVRFDDGTTDWYKIPNRAENPLAQEYQRRLSLAESTNQLLPAGPIPDELITRRNAARIRDRIPFYPGMDLPMQRREPNAYSKEMTQSYARFVAHRKAEETGKAVLGVKVYRVIHNLPTPKEIAQGISPAEKHFYYPYYQGEFTSDGTLKDPLDPYLYWILPIVKTQDVAAFRDGILHPFDPARAQQLEIVDLLEVHAHLETETDANPKMDPIPGAPAVPPGQKSAATATVPLTLQR